jgi:2-iminobutanoate/2-iminopropanoate deaminase
MNNIDGLLKSQDLSRDNIIKTTIFLTDLKNFGEINLAYQEFFTAPILLVAQ